MKVQDWGEIDYDMATGRQLEVLQKVFDGAEDQLIFCSHPPVVTLGRATEEGDLQGWQGSVVKSSRGGKATYHGPGQLVIYPIVHLGRPHRHLALRDVQGYLRLLEKVLIQTLAMHYDLKAESQPHPTGVWVGEKKVASIGVAVKRWITYHGVALNLGPDPLAFQGIKPCGFTPETMASLEELLALPLKRERLKEQLAQRFFELFAPAEI